MNILEAAFVYFVYGCAGIAVLVFGIAAIWGGSVPAAAIVGFVGAGLWYASEKIPRLNRDIPHAEIGVALAILAYTLIALGAFIAAVKP